MEAREVFESLLTEIRSVREELQEFRREQNGRLRSLEVKDAVRQDQDRRKGRITTWAVGMAASLLTILVSEALPHFMKG